MKLTSILAAVAALMVMYGTVDAQIVTFSGPGTDHPKLATAKADTVYDFSNGAMLSIVVSIQGGVKTPGVYKVASSAKLADLIGYAGGTLPQAHLSDVRFVHDLSIDSTQTVPTAVVDYEAYLKTGNPAGNPMMYPNDTIVISTQN